MKGPKSIQYVTSAILERDIYIERERESYVYTHTQEKDTSLCWFSAQEKKSRMP